MPLASHHCRVAYLLKLLMNIYFRIPHVHLFSYIDACRVRDRSLKSVHNWISYRLVSL